MCEPEKKELFPWGVAASSADRQLRRHAHKKLLAETKREQTFLPQLPAFKVLSRGYQEKCCEEF